MIITTNFFISCKITQHELLDEFGESVDELSSTFDETFDSEKSSDENNTQIYDCCDESSSGETTANDEDLEDCIPLQELKNTIKKQKKNKIVKKKDQKKFKIEPIKQQSVQTSTPKKSFTLHDSNHSKDSKERVKLTFKWKCKICELTFNTFSSHNKHKLTHDKDRNRISKKTV